MSEIIEEFLAKNKEESLTSWLDRSLDRMSSSYACTHPVKFTHPRINQGSVRTIIYLGSSSTDGFFRSGNVKTDLPVDITGNATNSRVIKFLHLELEDGDTVLKHFEKNSSTLKQLLNPNYLRYKQDIYKIYSPTTKGTNRKLNQVFFPTKEGYHLLSLLTPSMLLYELKNRVVRNKLKAIVKIRYGHNRPLLVSYLNTQQAGFSYALRAEPPVLKEKYVKLPKKNFFRECLDTPEFIQHLANFKEGHISDELFLRVFNPIVKMVVSIKSTRSGWTNSLKRNLPKYQNKWLDSQYEHVTANSVVYPLAWWLEKLYKDNYDTPPIDKKVLIRFIKKYKDGLL